MYKIWLDDIRNPKTDGWEIARSVDEAKKIVERKGLHELDYISFDHDLGENETAMSFVHWLIDLDMQMANTERQLPKSFWFNVHSQNPVGTRNIESLLICYLTRKNPPDVI